MDKKLYEALGVPPFGAFSVTQVNMMGWGQDLVLTCYLAPDLSREAMLFSLIFKDCRDFHWRAYAHLNAAEDVTLPRANILNLNLGEDQHRKAAHILTDFFGLTVLYGEMVIKKHGWQTLSEASR
jgi:hypothetical protein